MGGALEIESHKMAYMLDPDDFPRELIQKRSQLRIYRLRKKDVGGGIREWFFHCPGKNE
jgi:hypothetical protein